LVVGNEIHCKNILQAEVPHINSLMEGAFGTRADGVGAYRQLNILYFLHSIFSNISTAIYIKTCSMTPEALYA